MEEFKETDIEVMNIGSFINCEKVSKNNCDEMSVFERNNRFFDTEYNFER